MLLVRSQKRVLVMDVVEIQVWVEKTILPGAYHDNRWLVGFCAEVVIIIVFTSSIFVVSLLVEKEFGKQRDSNVTTLKMVRVPAICKSKGTNYPSLLSLSSFPLLPLCLSLLYYVQNEDPLDRPKRPLENPVNILYKLHTYIILLLLLLLLLL